MFEWLGIWSRIKKSLGTYAKGKAYKLLSKLKALRASTTSDLADLIAASSTLSELGMAKVRTVDKISDPSDSSVDIEIRTVPMSYIAGSTTLAKLLAKKLQSNVDLNAARNAAGISDQDWHQFLESYAGSFVKFVTPMAIAKLIDTDAKVYGDEVILAIAEGEGYKVNGIAGYHDMIKFFHIPSYKDRKAEIKRARRTWARREKISYQRNV